MGVLSELLEVTSDGRGGVFSVLLYHTKTNWLNYNSHEVVVIAVNDTIGATSLAAE